jgi:hypothetical protein
VVPFQGAWLGLLAPERREHVALAFQGHDDHIRAWCTSPATVAETELLGLHRAHPPMRLCDVPVPPAQLRSWVEYLWPAGFREVLAVGLLAPLLGHAVDPLLSAGSALLTVAPGWRARRGTPSSCVPIPGRARQRGTCGSPCWAAGPSPRTTWWRSWRCLSPRTCTS